MYCPVGIAAPNAVGRVEVRRRVTSICRLEGVDGIGLDENLELRIRGTRVHTHNQLASNLRGDYIVGNAVDDLLGIVSSREEVQQLMINAIEVFAVLAGVVKAAFGDLGKLAGSVEALRREWVARGGVDLPWCTLSVCVGERMRHYQYWAVFQKGSQRRLPEI
jgi:hypothetical protein